MISKPVGSANFFPGFFAVFDAARIDGKGRAGCGSRGRRVGICHGWCRAELPFGCLPRCSTFPATTFSSCRPRPRIFLYGKIDERGYAWNSDGTIGTSSTLRNMVSRRRRRSGLSNMPGRRTRVAGRNKWRVVGRGYGERWLQVVFVFDPEEEDPETEDTAYVIHARPLTDREKRRERKRSR